MQCFFPSILHRLCGLLILGSLLSGCTEAPSYLFQKVSNTHSGVDFTNTITETEDFNILNFHYIYNGGGVGVGDFDENGLPDLVFTGNQVPSKLYLNQGTLQFKDVTASAKFNTTGWATGVAIVDVNADGWLDIYVSVGGTDCTDNCKNQLFIHQGLDENKQPIFEEQAEQYGLADGLYTQQAAFFDYDLDGDLDVYLLHNVIDRRDKNAPTEKRFISSKSMDQLLQNDGSGRFVDVSDALGIQHRGYGLGITINDFNGDHLPDIYVANDFLSDDLLYLNRGVEGGVHLGFEEGSHQYLKHTSYNAMGVDIADVNNDALPDIVVLDMLPAYNERQKTSQGFMNYNKFLLTLRQDYAPQFIRNTLQIHNGLLNGELLPFSEVGHFSGIYNTDWSWTPLLADFDNDGDRDLFVTNGYGKDITDLDFINYSQTRNPFGTKESQQKELYQAVEAMEPITMPNVIFENQGALRFKRKQNEWLKAEASISNGAVYTDLDLDGDLDLVVNNINDPAYILENTLASNPSSNFLKLSLNGPTTNPSAIGAEVKLWIGEKVQVQYQSPVRGYLSSVDATLHFGLGAYEKVDQLEVYWPDGKVTTLNNISVNSTLSVDWASAKKKEPTAAPITASLFELADDVIHLEHQESIWQDFDAQPLLMRQHSRQGPCMVKANIDGTKGEELFIGGAKNVPSQLLLQDQAGQFLAKALPYAAPEDIDACFFDFDQDGDLDLYVVSGSVEFKADAAALEDRLYLNDGAGNFTKSNMTLPRFSGSCVRASDFDQDGDIDLFVGGRVQARAYPNTPPSSLLLNENGILKEQTIQLAPDLARVGMVTDATWQDIDSDGWEDLIVVGEWMPITIFKNEKGQFPNTSKIVLENTSGLWNTIAAADMDRDGDVDFVLGNLGRNSRLQATTDRPLYLYGGDYDQNGSPDPLIGHFYTDQSGKEQLFPLHSRDDIMKQLVKLKNRYVSYAAFGAVTFEELLEAPVHSADYLKATCLSSVFVENTGKGGFQLHELPTEAQLAPIQSILIEDWNGDSHLDILLVGNDFTCEKNNGWYDALNGLLLKGDGHGTFVAMPSHESGFYVPGDGRSLTTLTGKDGETQVIAGQNSGAILAFDWLKPKQQ